MNTEALERHFAAIGARLEIEGSPFAGGMKIDVRADRRGEHFVIVFHGGTYRGLVQSIAGDATCSSSLVRKRRRASSFAATTSGTGSSQPFPRTPEA